jgi:hypothetical protein
MYFTKMKLIGTLAIIFVFTIFGAAVTAQGQLVSKPEYTTGIISGFSDSYSDNDEAVIQVIDKDMVVNTSGIASLQVHVWSYTDANGILITLYETKLDSGVFEGKVYFSSNLSSSGNILQVSKGDKITAEYIDALSQIGVPEHIDMFTHINDKVIPPSPPLNLIATVSNSDIVLTWSPPESDGGSAITGYKIERNDGSGYQTVVSNTNSYTTQYYDTKVVTDTKYEYRIFAINSVGTSNPSNETSISTQSEKYDFQISPNTVSLQVKQGESTLTTITVVTTEGKPRSVSLSCSFQTPSIHCYIEPSVLSTDGSVTLTVIPDKGVPSDNYVGSVTATSNGLNHDVVISVTVSSTSSGGGNWDMPSWALPLAGSAAGIGGGGYVIKKMWKSKQSSNSTKSDRDKTQNFSPYPRLEVEGDMYE